MKFIHAADAHIDSPFMGLKQAPATLWETIHQSTFTAFKTLIQTAIDEQVDFVLLVGDSFDQEAQSLPVQRFLQQQFERLAAVEIPVYLSYGNHDYWDEQQVHFEFPSNVHVFKTNVETMTLTTKAQETVTIVGFSYGQRWLTANQVDQFPPRATTDYMIGTIHGSQQANPDEDHYAPFTLSQLNQLQYDYWALGHIHKRQILQERPYVVYPGNLQGRHKNEPGQKGFYVVNADAGQFKLDFRPTTVIEWQRQQFEIQPEMSLNQLQTQISAQLQQSEQASLVSLELTHAQNLSADLLQRINHDELLLILQEQLTNSQPLHWPYALTLKFDQQQQFSQIDQTYWQAAAAEIFTPEYIRDKAQPLMKEGFIRDAVTDEQYQADLKALVETILQEKKLGE
ncbi:metallophosphoesterase family protein [Latilactobacillus fuchuensis]|uniref:Calcineurin-like phosphoesterase family protein n=2 Tax=Latilactobacillus fuchuensis TaxID=164393 RepID=A0A2N9DUE2_9LACO|nr:DNA repair exonuclease [Latilactobacillus fuchuensis]KRL61594.1 calcineurin-like phosphoesterase family protein [Latilactobacillus fuchuensis DSM 14340 = JCM 11249]SPC37638.1 Calcineurin-like phosphoesterase family protein [Latilactobacillus fuchuensis]